MFRSKSLSLLLAFTLLLASAMLMSGCNCGANPSGCISATNTPLPVVTAPPPSADAPPAQIISRFIEVYSDTTRPISGIGDFFTAAYAASGAALDCAVGSIRSSYGSPSSVTLGNVAITSTLATAQVSMVMPTGSQAFSFTLRHEAAGWRIDAIGGWPGGDITPATPVGGSQSCLAFIPATKLGLNRSNSTSADGAIM